ncbi:nitrilase/beta-cyano-L-alanine hydratase/nitrilase [Amycolatopsis arida]|uniref:Nitrilase/beta-cyano-L-alanine hydratase/nitrilase n=1 Tax=Amycolatopsis arida TaxID=587909 RepID=A0A1I5LZT5_9PSEU|nr:nitrilase-related carbon-nitrogen hydrolase [Amycolatopsis arida]TDX93908.1 nitrilase/beta-cyano-L-alanine hydratase/nitrilase [Amycolatopsis arida]SFP02683.1 nitrilase/beta-cyano-L-alanine hydratase/nitrilase [Amycolatopsis arida]
MPPEPEPLVRAAVVQAAPVGFDLAATLAKVERLTADAAAGGVDLVVFPEAFVSCYPRGVTFGALIGSRTPEGRALYRRYWNSSVDVPGPATERLGAIAARHRTHLVIGVIERGGATLYCTALTFNPHGRLLGKHRKLMPTAAERLVWGFGDGSTLPVHDTPIGRIGTAICWENYMPLLRMHLYGRGVQLYCAPTMDHRDVWVSSMRHVALEGRCFVLSACQFARRADYPDDYPIEGVADGPDAVVSAGNSVIVDPLGEVLAGPATGGETILRAELDLGRVAEGKYDFDVAGHYARPDVFTLLVDERPRPPVRSTGTDPPD